MLRSEWTQQIINTVYILKASASRLESDRKLCSAGHSDNQHFLCAQEAKLVRYFSRVIVYSQRLEETSGRNLSDLEAEANLLTRGLIKNWLAAVNLSPSAQAAIKSRFQDLSLLLRESEEELGSVAEECGLTGEDARRFTHATANLRKYTSHWKNPDQEPSEKFGVVDLCWFSFERDSETGLSGSGAEVGEVEDCAGERRSVSESSMNSGTADSGLSSKPLSNTSLPTTTPPPSPGLILGNTLSVHPAPTKSRGPTPPKPGRLMTDRRENSGDRKAGGKSPSSTPPPVSRWGTYHLKPDSNAEPPSPSRGASGITRSHSHESNLENRIIRPQPPPLPTPHSPGLSKPSTLLISRSEHDNVGGKGAGSSSPHVLSPDASFPSPRAPPSPSLFSNFNRTHQLPRSASTSGMGNPPKSPRTGGRLLHMIPHQFKRKMNPSLTCAVCKKSFGMKSGEKCRSCKMKVHTECKAQLSEDTCGLKKEHVTEIIKLLVEEKEYDAQGRIGVEGGLDLQYLVSPPAEMADGSSSSCNSSAPSTPAPPWLSPFPSSSNYTSSNLKKFTFPDLPEQPEVPNITIDGAAEENPSGGLIDSYGSTVRSQGSGVGTESGGTLSQEEVGAGEGGEDGEEGGGLRRDHWNQETLRGAWREVTIPFQQITFGSESLVGIGRFGQVHKGYWHQDVAVKLLNMDHVSDENQLETFKMEVASFKNTRHDNIVLFVGYCLDPPKLGIVMNFCKGKTLHNILHNSWDRLDMSRVLTLATQITQGMSYLHGKRIMHKDLRTKNIFVEPNSKVVITDFGLFSLQRLIRPGDIRHLKSLRVPDRWLSYLAPEMMRVLLKHSGDGEVEELPFSYHTDIFAFGSVWYELLTGEFPYKKMPPESVIWQVGKGMKPALGNFQGHKDMKDILMQCWAYESQSRPDFNQLFKSLDRIPKKRLIRSPSHPIHLSRSAESMF